MADMTKHDDKTITMPKGYEDGILEHAHQVVRGENVVTCRLDIREPQKQIGKDVVCPHCTTVFHLIEG
jgi:hypothetical protein